MSLIDDYRARWASYPKSDGPASPVSDHHAHLVRHPSFEQLCDDAKAAGHHVELAVTKDTFLAGDAVYRNLDAITVDGVRERITGSLDETAKRLLNVA